MKGYRLLDLNIREIFISRDVIFHEQFFPFHDFKFKVNSIGPFPNLVLPVVDTNVSPSLIDDSCIDHHHNLGEPRHDSTVSDSRDINNDLPTLDMSSVGILYLHLGPSSVVP